MKYYLGTFLLLFILLFSCNSIKTIDQKTTSGTISDTVRIANEELEYEVIIIDAQYSSWLYTNARPRNYYSKSFLESRNRVWLLEWNRRTMNPSQYNPNLYEMTVNYDPNVDYGYEVNYLIYNYLVFFQNRYNQPLGTFSARI